ncbi:MAG: hypothetical protein AAGA81_09235 [Acidobacteriota bacterium]
MREDVVQLKAGDLARVVLRVVGVWLSLQTLAGIPGVVAAASYQDLDSGYGSTPFVLLSGGFVIAQGAVALACLFNTELLTRWLLGEGREAAISARSDDLVAGALRVVGLTLVALNLPGVVASLLEVAWLLGEERSSLRPSMLARNWQNYVLWLGLTCCGALLAWKADRAALIGKAGATAARVDE